MAFRMRPEVDEWFKHIFKQGPIQTKFDLYYFCLMMGLASGRSDSVPSAVEFVQNFVGEYKGVQRLVLGLLIIAEISRLGLELNDRNEVQDLFGKYLDANDATHLSGAGFERLNDYSHGGFNAIVESAGGKPYHIEPFVQWYVKELRKRVDGNKNWEAFKASLP
jgi:hypothetical protein